MPPLLNLRVSKPRRSSLPLSCPTPARDLRSVGTPVWASDHRIRICVCVKLCRMPTSVVKLASGRIFVGKTWLQTSNESPPLRPWKPRPRTPREDFSNLLRYMLEGESKLKPHSRILKTKHCKPLSPRHRGTQMLTHTCRCPVWPNRVGLKPAAGSFILTICKKTRNLPDASCCCATLRLQK